MNEVDEKRNQIIRNPTKISLENKCRRIIAGPHHSYAIADEAVYFWGLKHTYEIPHNIQEIIDNSNGNHALNAKLVTMPIAVDQIATGTSHSFAWNRKEVYCWGSNQNYELGLQEQRDYGVTRVQSFEQAISQGCNLRKIACGQHHTLVYFFIDQPRNKEVKSEKDLIEAQIFELPQDQQDKSGVQLYVWGQSQSYQLTVNTFDIIPYPVLSPCTFRNLDQIYSKNDFNVALCNGKVYSWGSNIFSRLGHNIPSSQLPKVRIPKQVSLSEKIIKIGIGSYHVVAVGQSGAAFSWGKGNQGQLGIDRFETESRPTKMVCNERIADVSCGEAHTMVLLSDGRLKTCGSNSHGALGHLHFDLNDRKKRAKKLQFVMNIQLVRQIKEISSGNNHNLILNKMGQVFGWGKNQYFQVIPFDNQKNVSFGRESSKRQFKLIENKAKSDRQRQVKENEEDRGDRMNIERLQDWKRRYKLFKQAKNKQQQKYLQQFQRIMQSIVSKSLL